MITFLPCLFNVCNTEHCFHDRNTRFHFGFNEGKSLGGCNPYWTVLAGGHLFSFTVRYGVIFVLYMRQVRRRLPLKAVLGLLSVMDDLFILWQPPFTPYIGIVDLSVQSVDKYKINPCIAQYNNIE